MVATLGVPVILLLLFVGVFGGALAPAMGFAAYMTAGIIDRFRTMAIARVSVLTGHVVGVTVRTQVSMGLVIGIAVLMGFRPVAGFADWLAVLGVLVLFVVALTWMAVAIGLVVKNPEGTSGFTPIIDTLRGLLLGSSVGDNAVVAVIWCVGIGAVGYFWARTRFNR
jgi:ABC-2 type transport system permease protein